MKTLRLALAIILGFWLAPAAGQNLSNPPGAGGGGSGTVTSVTCNGGLNGGTFTTTGTCSLNTANANTWSANQSFGSGNLLLNGATSGTSTLNAPATGGGTATLFAGTDTIAGKTVANGGTNCGAASLTCLNNITGFSYAGTTGTTTGNLVGSVGPTFTGSPALSTSTGTSLALNGCTIGTDNLCVTGTSAFGTQTKINGNAIQTAPAAAVLQLGAADAAAPVAQTLQAQNVVGGTTNTAGANFTINGSQGTGTGAAGKLIFQIAPKGGSGTTQNAQVNSLQLSDSINSAFASCCSNTVELDTAGGNEIALASQGLAWANGTSLGGILSNTGVSIATNINICTANTCGGSHILVSETAPTITGAGCGGSAASISTNNGTAAFDINVGTAPTSGGCTVTMPPATTRWNCHVNDFTTISTAVFVQKEISSTTTSIVFQNFSDVAVATAPTASDIYHAECFAE